MIRLLTDSITPRLTYIANLLFREMMGTEVLIITDDSQADPADGPVINYRVSKLHGAIHIAPARLLFDSGIGKQVTRVIQKDDVACLFATEGSQDWPGDPLATSFYLVSRYEEYLSFNPDQHGRFPAKESILYKAGLLEEPLVNRIVWKLRDQITTRWPAYRIKHPGLTFVPSFDVDIAYAHLEKGMLRAAGGFAKLLLKAQVGEVVERYNTIIGKTGDPYDNFGLQGEVLRGNEKEALYFFLVGDNGPYDRNNRHDSERFISLVKSVNKQFETGIHPSYASADDPEKLTTEIARLRSITGVPVKKSRQHFLRISLPETYRELIRNGITDDHSMGYADRIAFRAGIAWPFQFYDLKEESVTNLTVHPFQIMDTAMIDHMGLSAEQAIYESLSLGKKVKEVGGTVCGVWHNYALSEKGNYRGWIHAFRETIRQLSKLEKT